MTAAVRTVRDLVYATRDGYDLALDLHLPPEASRPSPLVVYFHGGAFQVGTRTDHEEARAAQLAARGIAVATVSYRLLSIAPFPAALDDARTAVAWLREHGAEHGVATERIGSMGASAGGYLAAMLGLGNPREGLARAVDVAVPWYAVLDGRLHGSGTALERRLYPIDASTGMFAEPYDAGNPAHLAIDPLENVSAGAAEFLVVTGDRDRVVSAEESRRFHDVLVLAGARSSMLVVGGAGHEDEAFQDGPILDFIASLFRSRLG
ncbi:hypothetical protein GCM10011490_21910 [Pseudoclavibacter endophyticus]|uniref:alpha/beta hydrolase n=1 Tax=Pseudoclavibacter endophyticus TaxID=1778590 RepID=UPI00166463C8|nr:alpha/beta hydrolase [Pseudoclavibacter endophyticus]GGA70873.1 hypothetical protein GCM10011490_21910 [Pseudoclavibacter endophyticus]